MRLAALLALVVAIGLVAVLVRVVVAAGEPAGDETAAGVLAEARSSMSPTVVYRSLDDRGPRAPGMRAVASIDDGGHATASALAPRRCARVYVSSHNGLCLARSTGGGYEALVLGPDLGVRHAFDVEGAPSRVRVSADGRYGSVTLFVAGHSYQASGLSTITTLVDMARGTPIAQLEQFTTFDGERQVTAEDMNFWGVTFASDSDRFYATLATGGRTWLVEGSVSGRTMRTLRRNVECPSLSPDGTRVAFKKRVGTGEEPWRLTVLDLATGRETPVAERRSVDDQVEWLDTARLLYGRDGQIWVARADGRGGPELFRRAASSPAVVRW